MAGYRQIHTKIWKDQWFLNLEAKDKLLFIYLFSNERACLAGIYELPIKVIAFETDLTEEEIVDALARFEETGKVFYQDGIVWVVNLIQYNSNNLNNQKIRTNIKNSVATIRDCPLKREWIRHYNSLVSEDDAIEAPPDDKPYPIDRVSIRGPHEHEHEHEQEHEHITNAADAASPPGNGKTPINLDGWLKLVRGAKNRAATSRYMVEQLYPYFTEDEVPDYGRIGATAKRVGGWGRLVEYLWTLNKHKPQGNIMNYIEVVHKNGGNVPNQGSDLYDEIDFGDDNG